jgi:hypothetical protein
MSESTSEPTVQPRVVEGQTSEPVVPMQEVSEASASAQEEPSAKAKARRVEVSCGSPAL